MTKRPNILLITCDQYRFPRFSYGAAHGLAEGLKDVLGFQPLKPDNDYIQHFPGLAALRDNAVLLANHTIAASACTPSRTVIYTGQYETETVSFRTGLENADLRPGDLIAISDPSRVGARLPTRILIGITEDDSIL